MATAPRPGAAKRQAAKQQAQSVLRMTFEGRTLNFCPDNIPFSEQVVVRKACGGLPFAAFWGGGPTIGEDSLQLVWWLARRAAGEHNLQLATVLEEWPNPLRPEDFNIEFDEASEADVDPES